MTGLEAVRTHHLEAARARAVAILRDARAEAQQIIARSAADAALLIATAENEGEQAAELDSSRRWTAARRRARGILLAAQRELYEALVSEIALRVRTDPRYPDLLEHLADDARRELGPGAEVSIDRVGVQGVRATRKDRHVDWSLEKIVDGAVERRGPEIEEIWR